MRVSSVSFAVTFAFAVTSTIASVGFRDCIEPTATERVACVERKIAGRSFQVEDLLEIDRLIPQHPTATLEMLSVLEDHFRDRPSLRAEILDRQAEAFYAQGDPERAAERKTAAVATDAGVRSLEWWSPEGGLLWTAPLDLVTERHVEGATALAAIGRDAQARALLASAMRLGATGEAKTLWTEIGKGAVEGLDPTPTPLIVRPWFPRLPPVMVPILGDEPFPLAEERNDVLILDFWASWCTPCLEELPAINRLYETEKENGLQVIAVNMGESVRQAEGFARDLGLEMPVGLYDDALEEAFNVQSLPTVIVADRNGRVRARWDGYRNGLEEEIASLARSLLPLHDEEPGEPIGEVLKGGGLLEIEWARNVAGDVDGLTVASLDGPDAVPALVALGGRHVLIYDWRGAVVGFVDRPPHSGALRRSDLDGDGRDELFSFRFGGTQVARLDLDEGAHPTWEGPAPLLDLALLPKTKEREATVAMATVAGLYRAGTDLVAEIVPGFARPTGLLAFSGVEGPPLGVVGRERGFCKLDPFEPENAICSESEKGSRLVASPGGVGAGIIPRGVAAVGGRLLGGAEGEIALITSTGQLVILDSASGEERFRARVDGARALAAGDLDGDGVDELALAVGERTIVLKNPAPAPPSSHGDHENALDHRPEMIDSSVSP